MPNYTLSRTSPPAHIYERKINLGYGVKVDTSDAPQPKKEKNMNDVKQTQDVVELPVPAQPLNGQTVVVDNGDLDGAALEAKKVEEGKNYLDRVG